MLVFFQYPVRQRPVSQQFDRAVEVAFQPFFRNARIGMVIQCLVDAGNGLDMLQYRADVVADENNGAIFVNLRQQFVEPGFETFVDVRAGFVENHHRGSEMMARPSSARCNCPPLKRPMTVLESFEPHAGDHVLAFLAVLGSEAGSKGFWMLSPESMTSSTESGISGRWCCTGAITHGESKLEVES